MCVKEDDWCPRCDQKAWFKWRWDTSTTRPWHSHKGVGKVVKRNGKYGEFLGCSNFPKCDWSSPTKETAEEREHNRLMRNALWHYNEKF